MNDKTTYYQGNGEGILNRAKENYKNNKERLREKARNKSRDTKGYQKNYHDAKKSK